MNTSRQRSNTRYAAHRSVWPTREELTAMQTRWGGESVSSSDSALGADDIEAFFHHALGAVAPEELEDLLHGD